MRTKLTIFFTSLLMCYFCFFPAKVKSQAVEQGTILIDVFYAGPNLWSSIIESAYTSTYSEDITIKSFGPMGIRGEYLLSDNFGIGLDIMYTTNSIEWKEEDYYDPATVYTYKVSIPRPRIIPRFNFHLSQNDDLDVYFVAGVGYNGITYKFETDDPDFEEEKAKSIIPVAWRIGVGARYFFTDNIGIGAEIGLGAALYNIGASFKF